VKSDWIQRKRKVHGNEDECFCDLMTVYSIIMQVLVSYYSAWYVAQQSRYKANKISCLS